MIVTKKIRTIYKIEMTDKQRTNLILLLENLKTECRDLIAIQSNYGKERMIEIAETADDLLQALKGDE